MMMREDVHDVVLHMCEFGLRSRNGGLAKKPTRVLTNMEPIAKSVNRKCSGKHFHEHLVSGRAQAASEYTEEFVDSLLIGIDTFRMWQDES